MNGTEAARLTRVHEPIDSHRSKACRQADLPGYSSLKTLPFYTYLFLLGRGVQHEIAIRVQGTADPAEESPHGHTCIHQCHAGSIQAAGQELSITGRLRRVSSVGLASKHIHTSLYLLMPVADTAS